jgi:hypothetical protein
MAEAKRELAAIRELGGAGLKVVHMDWHAIDESAPGDPAPSGPTPEVDQIYWDRAVMRSNTKQFALAQENNGIVGLAKPASALCDRLQYRLDIGGRSGDHAEDFAGRGLMSERFGELPGTCLHFVEQSRVLDGDDRLVGEGLNQLDLFVREGRTVERVSTIAPITPPSRMSGTARMVRYPPILLQCCTASESVGTASTSGIWTVAASSTARPKAVSFARRERATSHELIELSRVAVAGEKWVIVPDTTVDGRTIRLA